MKRIPEWAAMPEIVITAFVTLSMLSILIYAPFWTPGGLSKRRRRPAERSMRTWPLISMLSLLGIVGIFMACSDDQITPLGNLTVWSAALCAATILFALSAVMSAIGAWRVPTQSVGGGVRRHSMVVSVALLIATVYLAYYGVIGLRMWA